MQQASLLLHNQMSSVPPTVGYNGIDILKSHRSNFKCNAGSNNQIFKK
jgi:hypothetical protein